MVVGRLITALLWIIISDVSTLVRGQSPAGSVCLTGSMTDVQSWVDEKGTLTPNVDSRFGVDLSTQQNPSQALSQKMNLSQRSKNDPIRYLSMARCGLTRIPGVFDSVEDSQGRYLFETLQYLSLYGNRFVEVSVPGKQYDVELSAVDAEETTTGFIQRGQVRAMWSAELNRVQFQILRELDLRACGIGVIDSYTFKNMPMLVALYLSDNIISTINANAFTGLRNLIHLDLSRNFARDEEGLRKKLDIVRGEEFLELTSLRSLDFSNTTLNLRAHNGFKVFGNSLERLSLCDTGLFNLQANYFNETALKFLDISGNHGILINDNTLTGLEDTLEVLYAEEIGLTTFDIFKNFARLEVLRVGHNEISNVQRKVAKSLTRLQALDLRRNRFANWYNPTFTNMPALKYLDLRCNTINMISQEIITDIQNVSYVGLSGNMVCSCNLRDFIDIGARNEKRKKSRPINPLTKLDKYDRFMYHTGFLDLNAVIDERENISNLCTEENDCYEGMELQNDGKFLILDYDEDAYSCVMVPEGIRTPFEEVQGCSDNRRDVDLNIILNFGRTRLMVLLVIPAVLIPLVIVFVFRRNLKYFYVTMRNSALISMVNKNKTINDDTIFNYDVFVSYCNEDRPWVLDHLLTQLESECSVSLCLHERDFQVGLSILENIVSCMDRSKTIMLVISQQFLLSQWCQFEMHLAQHRLLETRREDLILILLEEIPRLLRPNTLHYLMLSKTYIVWPKHKSEQHLFWKRLKKSVITQKQKPERVSLA